MAFAAILSAVTAPAAIVAAVTASAAIFPATMAFAAILSATIAPAAMAPEPREYADHEEPSQYEAAYPLSVSYQTTRSEAPRPEGSLESKITRTLSANCVLRPGMVTASRLSTWSWATLSATLSAGMVTSLSSSIASWWACHWACPTPSMISPWLEAPGLAEPSVSSATTTTWYVVSGARATPIPSAPRFTIVPSVRATSLAASTSTGDISDRYTLYQTLSALDTSSHLTKRELYPGITVASGELAGGSPSLRVPEAMSRPSKLEGFPRTSDTTYSKPSRTTSTASRSCSRRIPSWEKYDFRLWGIRANTASDTDLSENLASTHLSEEGGSTRTGSLTGTSATKPGDSIVIYSVRFPAKSPLECLPEYT